MIDPRTARLLTVRLAQEQVAARLPSVVAGLARDGELVWSGGCGATLSRAGGTPGTARAGGGPGTARAGGAPDADTQYRCGSITKTFVAVEVMKLRDAGRLRLTDPIGDHIAAGQASPLTIAQLLSHSGGLRAETEPPWWERSPGVSFDRLRDESLGERASRWEPGRRLHYSNVGFALLGELITLLTGRPWFEAVRTDLLAPLRMSRTTARPEPPHADGFAVHPHADVLLPEPEHDSEAMAPAGQIWTTVEDLARWTGLLGRRAGADGDNRAAGGRALLSEATLAEMREPRGIFTAQDGAWTEAYGLGLQLWNENGKLQFGHSGSMPGFIALMNVVDETRDAVIILCNSTYGFGVSLGEDLLRLLAENEPRMPAPWSPDAVGHEVIELLGTWYWGPSPFVLKFAHQMLELQPSVEHGRGSRFRREADAGWTGLDDYFAGEPLVVVRDPDGGVRQLEIASFVFTRTPYDPRADVPGGLDPSGWR